MRQFPLVCLKVAGNDFMIDIEGYMKAKKGNMTLRSVVFSETLLKEVGVGKNNESMLDKADSENDVGQGDCIETSKDAMKALVNAPMLIDLNLWLHWDMVFAPSLGSLVGWLLNEVEFCHFAADILLSGVQPFVKDAPLAILDECERIDQRLMLHRVGMSLGIVEWVEDKHKLSVCSDTNSLMSSRSSCLKVAEFDFSKNSNFTEEVSSECPLSRTEISFSQDPMRQHENQDASCSAGVVACVSSDNFADSAKQHSCELESSAASVIESIQREEFGLQPDLSPVESAVLNKQHARLGRALDCLSQELYSQDSHFILELICILTFCNICLVQNADDNTYLEHVEPTLTFILQYKGIIVLNNECGFSADNIRALCDVENSTKKGRNAGYIGKKGIGFKSVFRVTDAPEIHSSGFHIKFDISEGQIGFVLPTVVPPCDIDSYTRLASLDSDCNHGNTCIVLPFRSSLLETSAVENIVSMFSDLHPSLLLFLHGLHCIIFRNMLSDSTFLMRKEVVGNGIVKEALDGTYNAHLTQQPVFAFLPLRKYGLKFILQGDFVLPSSREEVDGDSPWNQWWLSEFPGLFVSAERSFCDLLCFKDNPAKGVTAYMSFVPLVGEVHGFFSGLPWMILSKLRMSNCLIIGSTETQWVLPCKTLRNWTQEACNLLPDSFLLKHLGVGFLHEDIVLTDLLARALGIEEYGLKVLFQVITSLCTSVEGLHEFGMVMCVDVYMMLSHGKSSAGFETEMDLMKNLKKIPFIPLSDGKYGSLDEGAIWLHVDQMGAATNDEYAPETFPRLYSMLRTVSPTLLSDAAALGTSCSDSSMLDNVTRMLYRVGVQRLSAHQIVKMHILPFICRDDVGQGPRELLTEYYAFLMFHLQSSCPDCQSEKDQIIREVEKNISDVCSVPINATLDGGLNSRGSVARDWMSDEFVDLLSQLSSTGDKEKCKYLLEVRSNKLLTALGLKIQVTVDDTLAILKAWRAELTLSASLSQMSKFYNFIWSKMNTSERKVVEELRNERFVFVPCKLVASHEDVVPGVLLSFKEVFWRDLTGSTDQVKMIFPESDPHSVQHPFTKMLCSVYPSLHDFFVKECGVNEFPHFHGYLQILLQLSATALPSQAAKNVFEIFLKWIDELNSGSLGSEDIGFLKQGLLTTDYLVLPTAEDKWGKILYAKSDSHSIFMELSRLFSIGTPDLHLANFLHMITTMAESGSTEEQTEFFIMNSQKMPKLPADESVWSLANVPLSEDGEVGLMSSSRTMNETTPVNFRKRPKISSNSSDWKTAPGSVAKSPATSGLKAYAQVPTEIACVENADNDPASAAAVLGSQDADHVYNVLVRGPVKLTFDPPRSMTIPHDLNYSSSDVAERDHLYTDTPDPQQALSTGRLGEFVAFKYFAGKHGEPVVKWVNETNETGLPYNLVVRDDEYIEVKATRATTKDWFHITSREWQFAVEKGESFSIAQVSCVITR
ncbi:putative 50S ribosomal protein L13, chloroplastic-like isoform X1 [Capsicum annuum]|nr:putative 50S ribosomal protein L13, chloroplastic-like isoform X1 [Capsicum annuum]